MQNEIIIDGVNVAECEFYYYSIQTHCNYCKSSQYSSYCNDYPDCHFKQIKRLKQAKEELQNLWANSTAERIKLEAENEKLKEEVKEIRTWEELKLSKYRKALEEIRDMAKYDCEYECSNDCTVCKIESCLEQRIMRKINEVLNEG